MVPFVNPCADASSLSRVPSVSTNAPELWRVEKSVASRLQAQGRPRASQIEEEETGAQEGEGSVCLCLIRNQSERTTL
jgi:hypothetical protein